MKSSTSKKQNAKEQYGMPLFIEMAQSFVGAPAKPCVYPQIVKSR